MTVSFFLLQAVLHFTSYLQKETVFSFYLALMQCDIPQMGEAKSQQLGHTLEKGGQKKGLRRNPFPKR